MIRPPALRPGDVVGIVSPSALTAAHVPRRLSRGLAELERRGFRVRMAEHAADAAARRADKVADLHAMFASEDVRAVVCTTGGASSHQLLEDLDFELIAANPKVFVGYSDITALHAAIWARTRLAVVQGPALLQQWAEFGGIDDYAWSSWERTLMRAEPAGEIAASAHWWYERLEYDKEDDRPRRREPNRGPRVVRAGAAEGPLVATNLCTLLLLVGTEWWPDLDGTILCLETAEEEQAWWIERSLHHLRHLGVWSKVAGVAFARCHPDSQLPEARLDEILLDATRGAAVPIAAGFDFGHTDPLACRPWGVRARLDGARLELLEAAVV